MTTRLPMTLILLLCALLPALAQANLGLDYSAPAPGNLKFTWIHGSLSAKANQDVRIQVHRYNEHTYILRQNPAVHWEAPFMYLLLGQQRAVLLDAGATAEPDYFPLYDTVKRLLTRWQQANGVATIELLVLPLGSDSSQSGALGQFESQAGVEILAPGSKQRQQLLTATGPGTIKLGGRDLVLIPTPGLNVDAISLYDPWTDILFTGNAFYPGRLVIRDFAAYRASLERLKNFSNQHPVAWIAGGRIEMTAQPGLDYILRSNYRPNERVLQMQPQLLATAYDIVNLINGRQTIQIHDDFIVMHGVGRGARAYGWPVYIPEQFSKPNTR